MEKALAGKPDDLSSNPEIHVAEENLLPKAVLKH